MAHRYTVVMNVTPKDTSLAAEAWKLWDAKAKPQLSLGRLEQLVVDIICMRRQLLPDLGRPLLLLFAADHGIVSEGVSSSPQEITWQQCENFAQGGGAIGLLCMLNEVDLKVVDVGVAHEFRAELPIIDRKIAFGTQNFAQTAAMTREQLLAAIQSGAQMVLDAHAEGRSVVAFGEMGIGNTSSSSAIMSCLTGYDIARCTGRGAGLAASALKHKKDVLAKAIAFHGHPTDPLEVLRTFGGFEIAAIAGGMLEAARLHMVILVDRYIASIAALIEISVEADTRDYMVFCHESGEGGHPALLAYLGVEPLLSLHMRLGEGTGAVVGWSIVNQAMQLYLHMTSFSSAHVTDSVALLKNQGVDFHGNET